MSDGKMIIMLAGITLIGAALMGKFIIWAVCIAAGITLMWVIE